METIDAHFWNAKAPILIKPEGNIIPVKAEQLAKAPDPTDVSVAGMSRVVRETQFMKALSGIVVILLGRMTDVKDEQPLKQSFGSDIRDTGSETVSKEIQFWKVPSTVILSGIMMCLSLVSPVKTF